MSEGYIDSASIHQVMSALRNGRPKDWTPWVLETVQGVTCALWSHPSLAIAPPFITSAHPVARGPFDQLLKDLSHVFSGIAEGDISALKQTRKYAAKNLSRIKRVYEETQADESFPQWLEWSISYWWPHHCAMHGALFDYDLIPQLSRIIGCSQADLTQVYELSRNYAQVEQWVRNQPQNEDFKLAADAYVVSLLLRGRYHDYVAKALNLQIMHHPIRERILPRMKPTVAFPLSDTERFLTNIVLAGGLAESNLESRIGQWAENITKVRLAVRQGRIDLSHKDQESVALDVAVDAARIADVRVHTSSMESLLDITLFGTVTLASFTLSPWLSVPVAVGEYLISRKLKIAERVTRQVYMNKRHLRDLAVSEPGRIQRKWVLSK